MDTERIFIKRVGYEGATTRTLPAPLTSLLMMDYEIMVGKFENKEILVMLFF